MTETGLFCPACERDSDDGLLCHLCARKMRQDVAAIPSLMQELEITLTRQSQTGSGNGGRSAVRPLPFDSNASEVGAEVKMALVNWVRTFEIGDGWPADRIPSICGWLISREARIRGHEEGAMFVDEMADVVRRLKRAIDLRPSLVYLGVCENRIDGELCRNQMYARARDKGYECPGHQGHPCGATYNVADRRAHLVSLCADQLATVSVCAQVLAMFGMDVKVDTVSRYTRARKGRDGKVYPPRIWAKGTSDKGEKLYRVGDLEEVAREGMAHRDARKAG